MLFLHRLRISKAQNQLILDYHQGQVKYFRALNLYKQFYVNEDMK
jgi:hypothetical protein